MRILLSNDDGINAPGIRAMQHGLKQLGDVIVVAPEGEQSAVGHAITISEPLRVNEVYASETLFGYSVNGTPADCVKIALKALLDGRPDIIVSGVNTGANVATNIIYSGTVSAATEGTLLGIPSLAVSLDTYTKPDFSAAVSFAVKTVSVMVKNGLPQGTLLNINVPALKEPEIKGVKVCRQSDRVFQVAFEKRSDLRGVDYYWQGGYMDNDDKDPKTDIKALEEGYITVTPIQYDLTNHSFMDELTNWEWKF
ncbi:MAG: 5'-nucleotidase SurE [bacterium]|nr:MAG: 5'-nucleotidase SurE [bacterium]